MYGIEAVWSAKKEDGEKELRETGWEAITITMCICACARAEYQYLTFLNYILTFLNLSEAQFKQILFL